jgi:putative component of membrane protein insertase Oxa1/YidC/SpoIIIJ protein YidD
MASLFIFARMLLPGLALADAEEHPLPYTLFKSLISSTDGKRCSHVPSCALYARDAVAEHGSIKGFVLSCDRLIRCGGDDTERLPQVVEGGKRYAWDPVSANDFWWKKDEALVIKSPPPVLPLHFKGWD